jgi:hypothetical protein
VRAPIWAPKTKNPTHEEITMTNTGALQGTTFTRGNAPSRRIPRRIGALLAGLFAIFAVTTAADVVLHATGIFPGWGQQMGHGLFLLAAAYRVVIGIGGSYLTARLAPDRPMLHALVLGCVGFALSITGAVAMWDSGPAWYPLAVIAMALPCAWAGGKLGGAR